MIKIYLYNNKIISRDNKLGISPSCCCDKPCCCDLLTIEDLKNGDYNFSWPSILRSTTPMFGDVVRPPCPNPETWDEQFGPVCCGWICDYVAEIIWPEIENPEDIPAIDTPDGWILMSGGVPGIGEYRKAIKGVENCDDPELVAAKVAELQAELDALVAGQGGFSLVQLDPAVSGWCKEGNVSDECREFQEPCDWHLKPACLRWVCRCVDSNLDLICQEVYGGPSINNKNLPQLVLDAMGLETEAGCYVYTIEFFGWLDREGPGGWISSDDMYSVYKTKLEDSFCFKTCCENYTNCKVSYTAILSDGNSISGEGYLDINSDPNIENITGGIFNAKAFNLDNKCYLRLSWSTEAMCQDGTFDIVSYNVGPLYEIDCICCEPSSSSSSTNSGTKECTLTLINSGEPNIDPPCQDNSFPGVGEPYVTSITLNSFVCDECINTCFEQPLVGDEAYVDSWCESAATNAEFVGGQCPSSTATCGERTLVTDYGGGIGDWIVTVCCDNPLP